MSNRRGKWESMRRLLGIRRPARLLVPAAVSGIVVFLLMGCGGAWPPPPGVREKAWKGTDAWRIRRRASSWKTPLEQDPVYLRYAAAYDRMEELDRRAQVSGWKYTGEYRATRLQLDRLYAVGRSLVYRLRSSGAEMNPNGQRMIEMAIRNLEDQLENAVREADKFETAAGG